MNNKIKTTFFIGGAPKSGTTSLWKCLSQHPNIYMGEEKEIYYFTHKYEKQKSWYLKKFENYEGEKEVGDGSINIICSEKAAIRINQDIESPKVIFLFRDPVERLISNYKWGHKRGKEYATTQSFNEWIDGMKKSKNKWTLRMGLYYENLKMQENHFGKEHIKCIKFEDLVSNPKETAKSACDFLGVDRKFDPLVIHENNSKDVSNSGATRLAYKTKNIAEKIMRHKINLPVSSYIKGVLKKSSSPIETSRENIIFLSKYYKEDICNLQDYLGWDLSQWLSHFEGLEGRM